MADSPPLLRQWQLLKCLAARRQGLSVREISEQMGVSQKTVRRDLELFQKVGFPLEEVVAEHGRKQWRIGSSWTEPQMNFTFDEAIALYMAQRFLEPLAGTPFWRAAQNAFHKIRSSLSDSVVRYLNRMLDKLHCTTAGAGEYSRKEGLLDQLMLGIEDNRAVFITYRSLRATEPVTYEVYPYGIAFHFGSLYLVGYHTDRKQACTWKIDRIEDAQATELPFRRPAEFSVERFFAGSFGVYHGSDDIRVKVRFAPAVARHVQESRWHTSQRLTCQGDGGLIAQFHLSATEEIKSWVLSFGPYAEVLEPESLRSEIAEDLQSALAAYRTELVPASCNAI
jgi:proteasome accessory factor B